MSHAQIFGQISNQNDALFLMERGAAGGIFFFFFLLLVDSLGLERTRKRLVIGIMYLNTRKAECWSENDRICE